MALHRLTRIVMGVPNIVETADFYADFGLSRTENPTGPGIGFATADGGEQLRIVATDRRRLVQLGVGADDPDDLSRIATNLDGLGFDYTVDADSITTYDPCTEVRVRVEIADRITQSPTPAVSYNSPGAVDRPGVRAPAILRTDRVRPRKLGHVVLGSVDQAASQRFFLEGIGFKVSDSIAGQASFMRCSTDHHNVLVQQTPATFMHHTSWQVDDVDQVGRGATAMLSKDAARHSWGLGRHFIGSNFFWYLRDPSGTFTEYYSDMDCIVDDALWEPGVWDEDKSLLSWGPPPPRSFLAPEDLAALMTGSHTR